MCPRALTCVSCARIFVVWGGAGKWGMGDGGGGCWWPCVFPPSSCCLSRGAVIKDEGGCYGGKPWEVEEISRTNRRKGRERKGMSSFSPPPLPLLLSLSSLRPFALESTTRGYTWSAWMTTRLTDRIALPCSAHSCCVLSGGSLSLVSKIRQRRTHGDAASRGRVVLDALSLSLSLSGCSPRRLASDRSATASAILC
jgi:hypothetical protein